MELDAAQQNIQDCCDLIVKAAETLKWKVETETQNERLLFVVQSLKFWTSMISEQIGMLDD